MVWRCRAEGNRFPPEPRACPRNANVHNQLCSSLDPLSSDIPRFSDMSPQSTLPWDVIWLPYTIATNDQHMRGKNGLIPMPAAKNATNFFVKHSFRLGIGTCRQRIKNVNVWRRSVSQTNFLFVCWREHLSSTCNCSNMERGNGSDKPAKWDARSKRQVGVKSEYGKRRCRVSDDNTSWLFRIAQPPIDNGNLMIGHPDTSIVDWANKATIVWRLSLI